MTCQEEVAEALNYSFEGDVFKFERFFKKWYRKEGMYFFLFRKNLTVTNIQYTELLSLLSTNIQASEGASIDDTVQFIEQRKLRSLVEQLVEEFVRAHDTKEEGCHKLAEIYADFFHATIPVETLFGSCAIFLPPRIDADIEAICANSGYIHSCGRNIYFRRVDKATKKELSASIKLYYLPEVRSGKKGLFVVYAHEDFSEYDSKDGKYLKNGLDDVKIHIEKYYVGDERLSSVINDIRNSLGSRLIIPDPGDYRARVKQLIQEDEIDRKCTLWLIVDSSIDEKDCRKGNARYYIAYQQMWKSCNPFHFFEEDKPAWIAHTTIPHTLMGAMINVALPFLPKNGACPRMVDPFGGSGTFLLEAAKIPNLVSELSDREAICERLCGDNLQYVDLDEDELENMTNDLELLLDSELTDTEVPTIVKQDVLDGDILQPRQFEIQYDVPIAESQQVYKEALEIIEQVTTPDGSSVDLRNYSGLVDQLNRMSPFGKTVFYLGLKTLLRNRGAWDRRSKTWANAFRAEGKVLIESTKHLIEARKKKSKGFVDNRNDGICIFQDTYSLALWPARCKEGNLVTIRDACALPEETFDAIVTDPPYGFNTDEELPEIALLYMKAIPSMLKALKNQGQIVMCLPELSFTGRTTASFIHKEFVLALIRQHAASLGKDVLNAEINGPLKHIYSPPYFWESERALRRAIIHLRVFKAM